MSLISDAGGLVRVACGDGEIVGIPPVSILHYRVGLIVTEATSLVSKKTFDASFSASWGFSSWPVVREHIVHALSKGFLKCA
jgi:hypothetical protein